MGFMDSFTSMFQIFPANKKSDDELLALAVEPLKRLGIDTSVFTPDSVCSVFLLPKQYIRHTRVFLSISDPAVMKETALAAARAAVWDLPSSLSVPDGAWKLGPADVFKISKWMKSAEGGDCMRLIYKKRKLERKLEKKKLYGSVTRREYKAERKEIESSYEKEIDLLLCETQRSKAVKSSECLKRKRESES